MNIFKTNLKKIFLPYVRKSDCQKRIIIAQTHRTGLRNTWNIDSLQTNQQKSSIFSQKRMSKVTYNRTYKQGWPKKHMEHGQFPKKLKAPPTLQFLWVYDRTLSRNIGLFCGDIGHFCSIYPHKLHHLRLLIFSGYTI